MKLNKKLLISTIGTSALAISVPVVLTSCSQGSEQNSSTGNETLPDDNNQNPGDNNNQNPGDNNQENNKVVLFENFEEWTLAPENNYLSEAKDNFFFFGRLEDHVNHPLVGLNEQQIAKYFVAEFGQKLENKNTFYSLMSSVYDLTNYGGTALLDVSVDYNAANDYIDVTLVKTLDGSKGKFVVFAVNPKENYVWGNATIGNETKTIYLAIQLF